MSVVSPRVLVLWDSEFDKLSGPIPQSESVFGPQVMAYSMPGGGFVHQHQRPAADNTHHLTRMSGLLMGSMSLLQAKVAPSLWPDVRRPHEAKRLHVRRPGCPPARVLLADGPGDDWAQVTSGCWAAGTLQLPL